MLGSSGRGFSAGGPRESSSREPPGDAASHLSWKGGGSLRPGAGGTNAKAQGRGLSPNRWGLMVSVSRIHWQACLEKGLYLFAKAE